MISLKTVKKEKKGKARLERQIADLELVKPHKEIEFGDIKATETIGGTCFKAG